MTAFMTSLVEAVEATGVELDKDDAVVVVQAVIVDLIAQGYAIGPAVRA